MTDFNGSYACHRGQGYDCFSLPQWSHRNLHAGKVCTVCNGSIEFSHISDEEMKEIVKITANRMYRRLGQRDHDPAAFLKSLTLGERSPLRWDDPEIDPPRPGVSRASSK